MRNSDLPQFGIAGIAQRFLTALLGAAFLLGAQKSIGSLRPDGTDDAVYVAGGANYRTNLLHFKVIVPGVGVGYRFGSAVYINSEYALTAAHTVTDLLQFNPSYEVGTGSSYLTNIGTVISATVTIYPGYNPTNRGSTIDLAIVHFSRPIPGVAAIITNALIGDVLSHAGFGMFGTPSSGAQPKDGNSRAWKAKMDFLPVLSGFSSDLYCATDFGPYIPNNGKALSGDSGGGVYDNFTNLVGIIIAQTGDTSAVGATIFLNLSKPEVYAWITNNTKITLPPPPSLSMGTPATLMVYGASNQLYQIQATTNLVDWQLIGHATNHAGTANFQDLAQTNFPARFYRAVVE